MSLSLLCLPGGEMEEKKNAMLLANEKQKLSQNPSLF